MMTGTHADPNHPQPLARHTIMSTGQRVLLMTALTTYSLLVFVLDIVTPLEIDVWVLNLPVIVVPVYFRNTRMVVYLCLACTAMVAFGWVGSPIGGSSPW